MTNVKIDDDVMLHRNFCDHRKDGIRCRGESKILGIQSDHMNGLASIFIIRGNITTSFARRRLEVLKLTATVIPPCEHLQHCAAEFRVSSWEAAGNHSSQQLGTFD
jgi:hypothetical protein